ncbi:hypothetical protein CBL_02607 [Carabus blaptoides fortunei]
MQGGKRHSVVGVASHHLSTTTSERTWYIIDEPLAVLDIMTTVVLEHCSEKLSIPIGNYAKGSVQLYPICCGCAVDIRRVRSFIVRGAFRHSDIAFELREMIEKSLARNANTFPRSTRIIPKADCVGKDCRNVQQSVGGTKSRSGSA